MLPFYCIEEIESNKVKYLVKCYIDGIYTKLGEFFDIYISELSVEYSEVSLVVGYTPKQTTLFVSTYLRDKVPLLVKEEHYRNKTLVFITPKCLVNPTRISRYDLSRLMSPINFSNNLQTEIDGYKVSCVCKVESRTLTETPYGTVEGVSALKGGPQCNLQS